MNSADRSTRVMRMLGGSCSVNSVGCGVSSIGRERELVQADGRIRENGGEGFGRVRE